MECEDRKFIAYLFSYATDRIITQIINSTDFDSYCKLCSYKDLKEQAEILVEEFEQKEPVTE